MSMKSAFSSFVKDLKADIKKELKIGEEKVPKEVDSGVVETSDTNEEQLAEYSEDENTTEEKSQEKSDVEEVKSDCSTENERNLDLEENKVESAVEHEIVEEKLKVHETEEKETDEPEKKDEPVENNVEKGEVENTADTAKEDSKVNDMTDDEPNEMKKFERPSIKREKSALQSFIDEAGAKAKAKAKTTFKITKKKPMAQERTYIVESGKPVSHTKSSTARSTNSGHVPMAEMIYRDQARLPDRFRYKPVDMVQVALTRTVPVTPMLHTYARKGKSRRELEGERIRADRIRREEESYKRPQFVARKYCFD